MDKENLVFVLQEEFDEEVMPYADAVSWAFSNLTHKNVLRITLDDVYLLNDHVLSIINEEGDAMRGPDENSWFRSQQTQVAILNKLEIYIAISKKKEVEITKEIIRLLEIAIKFKHTIYFHF